MHFREGSFAKNGNSCANGTSYSFGVHLYGGTRDTRSAAAYETAFEVVRHKFPHLLRVALPAPLVQSVEHKVVRGFFTDDLSAAAATVGRGYVASAGAGDGL